MLEHLNKVLWDNVSNTWSIDMLFYDGYVSLGAINSVLSGGCFLLLPGMPKIL